MNNIQDKISKFIGEFFKDEQFDVFKLLSFIEHKLSVLKGGRRKGEQYIDKLPDFRRPYPGADFGYFNEDYLSAYLSSFDELTINSFPNGQNNFPDIIINGINFDFKAVKCPINKNGKPGSPSYNNAINSSFGVEDDFINYFKGDTPSNLIKSFIIYTYYIIDDEDIAQIIGFDIIPTICTIKTDKNGFAMKYVSNDGIQNSNVRIGYSGINRTETYEECLNRLKNATKK